MEAEEFCAEEVEQIEEEEAEETDFNVIPVQLVEYESVSSASQSNGGHLTLVKGKYYKQTYRPAWEQMPDFKGWLRGVEGEATRAYCTYCHKTLHAHRLSLLKHSCSIRHQKAAQINASRKIKYLARQLNKTTQDKEDVHALGPKGEEGQYDENQTGEYGDSGAEQDEDSEHEGDIHEEDYEEEEECGNEGEMEAGRNFLKKFNQHNNAQDKPPIMTSVVDTARGKPVGSLQVSLYKLIDGRWTYINEGVTNSNGKFSEFLERCDFTPGRYKIHYDVDRYFEARKQATLYPFIEIVFDSTTATDSYHIPLLLSPFGYSTYKGS